MIFLTILKKSYIIDFDKYSLFMEALRSKYESRLEVTKGIEVGLQPHVLEESDKTVAKYCFDFVIASVHVIDGLDPYSGHLL